MLPSFKPKYVGTAPVFSCRKLLEEKMKQKAYLLRSAVLLAAVCVIPFALAQPNSSETSSAADSRQLPSLSDLARGGLVMRIPAVPVSQLPTRASGPTPTAISGPCQFQ